MSELDHHLRAAREIELAIERIGVVLDLDWDHPASIRGLARQALAHARGEAIEFHPANPEQRARVELFGLAQLMLELMRDCAQVRQFPLHGGPAWKAFGHALWIEFEGGDGG